MPYSKLWYHAVWTTKKRQQILNQDFLYLLGNNICQYANSKSIYVGEIGGWLDHLHLLFSLKPHQTISESIKLIKGQSSFWTNQTYLKLVAKLRWQDGYCVVTVSPRSVPRVMGYIQKQQKHHASRSLSQELSMFPYYPGEQHRLPAV